jgi:hypothetical protein
MSEPNLRLIAEARAHEPMSTWPDHIQRHRITIMHNPLFDHLCLRCWLERISSERLSAKAGDRYTGDSLLADLLRLTPEERARDVYVQGRGELFRACGLRLWSADGSDNPPKEAARLVIDSVT